MCVLLASKLLILAERNRYGRKQIGCVKAIGTDFSMGNHRRLVAIAAFAAFAFFRSSVFLSPSPTPEVSAPTGCGRREGLFALGTAAAFQAQSAWALNDARQDSICTYKCLAICNQKAPNNDEYCQKACKLYCEQSQAEQNLDSKVKKGSIVDKILEKSRKKKFDSNRADNSRTESLDLFIGGQLSLSNVTDYANGIKETSKIKDLLKKN
eukprot:s2891_g6.t1